MDDNGQIPRMSWRKSVRLRRTLRVAQTMVYVLNVLSEVAPDWIRTHVPIEWVERYGQRLEEEREPSEEQERTQYANQVGGFWLDAVGCAPSSLCARLDENTPCRDHSAHHVGATV
jgi:hypothetical protein